MKKIAILSVLLTVSLVACSSCYKKDQAVDSQDPTSSCEGGTCTLPIHDAGFFDSATEDAQVKNNVISQENWQFTLPNDDWNPTKSPNEEIIKVVLDNPNTGGKILFLKEPTTQTYAEYVLSAMRGLSGGGGNINSAKQVTVNSNNFILAEVHQKDVVIWAWFTEKNNYGYAFTCGGLVDADSGPPMENLCNSVASTLFIK